MSPLCCCSPSQSEISTSCHFLSLQIRHATRYSVSWDPLLLRKSLHAPRVALFKHEEMFSTWKKIDKCLWCSILTGLFLHQGTHEPLQWLVLPLPVTQMTHWVPQHSEVAANNFFSTMLRTQSLQVNHLHAPATPFLLFST